MTTETNDFILKVIGIIGLILSFRWLKGIYAGKDGELNTAELGRLIALPLFIWAFIYILIKEGNRPPSTDHIYNDTWLFFIITALLTVLHLTEVLDKMIALASVWRANTTTIKKEINTTNKSETTVTDKKTDEIL